VLRLVAPANVEVMSRPGPGWPIAATVASGLLFFFGTGMDPVPELAWCAPLPILLLAPRVSGVTALLCAFVAYAAGSIPSWSYFWHSLSVPRPAGIAILAGSALLFALATGLFRLLVRRHHAVLAVLAAAGLWTVALYAVSLLNPTGLMGTFMTTQADRPVVLQLASVTGGWGVEFLVLAVPAAAAAICAPGVKGRSRLVSVVAAAVVLTGLFFWSTARLSSPAGTTTKVALVVPAKAGWATDVTTPQGAALLQSYVDQIGALPDGVRVAVLPEAAFAVDDASRPALVEQLRRTGVEVVTGVYDTTPQGRFNAALDVPLSGPPVEFRKWHNGDSKNIASGTDLAYLAGPAKIGLLVCMDVNFADPSGGYGEAGTGLVLIPASDEDTDGWEHSRTALIRGVENGFSVAWSAARGTPMLSDAHGRVLADPHTGAQPFSVVTADVPLGSGATPYARLGDWFAWLCGLLAIGGIATGARRTAKTSAAVPAEDATVGA
jgi:apolipoprotein N-acyltransferase